MAGWVLSENTSEKYFTLPYDFKNGIAAIEKVQTDYGVDNTSTYTHICKSSEAGKRVVITLRDGTSGGTISRQSNIPEPTEEILPNPDGSKYYTLSDTILDRYKSITFTFSPQSHIDITIDGVSVAMADRLHLLGGTEEKIIDDELKEVRIPMTHYYTDGNDEWIEVPWESQELDVGTLDHDRTPCVIYDGLVIQAYIYKLGFTSYLRLLSQSKSQISSTEWAWHNVTTSYGDIFSILTNYFSSGNDLSMVVHNDKIYILGSLNGTYGYSIIIEVSLEKTIVDNVPYFVNATHEIVYLNTDSIYGNIGPYSIVFNGRIHNLGGGQFGDEHWKWTGSNYIFVCTLPQGNITGVAVYNNELYAIFNDDIGQLYKFDNSNDTWSEVSSGYLGVGSNVSLITANNNINILGGSTGSRLRARWNSTDGEWYPRAKDILGPIKNGWVNVITGWRDTYAMIGDREVYTGKEYIRTPKKIRNGWKITENGPVQILREVNHISEWDNTSIPKLSTNLVMSFPWCQSIAWGYYNNSYEWKDEIHIITDSNLHYVCSKNKYIHDGIEEYIWEWNKFGTSLPSGFHSCKRLFICNDQLWMEWISTSLNTRLSRLNYYYPGQSPTQTGVYSWELMSTITDTNSLFHIACWPISTLTYNSPDTIYRMSSQKINDTTYNLLIDEFDISSKTWTNRITYQYSDTSSDDENVISFPYLWNYKSTLTPRYNIKFPIIGWRRFSYYIDIHKNLIQVNHNTNRLSIIGKLSNFTPYEHNVSSLQVVGGGNLFVPGGMIHYPDMLNGAYRYFLNSREREIVNVNFYNSMTAQGYRNSYLMIDHTIPGPSFDDVTFSIIRLSYDPYNQNIDYIESLDESIYDTDLLPL